MAELDAIGLTHRDEAVYRALVDAGPATRAALAGVAGPRVGISPALDRLCEAGLIRALPGRPVRYVAVAPDIALAPLLLAEEAALARARVAVSRMLAEFRSIVRAPGAEPEVITAEVITDAGEVRRRAAEFQLCARQELRVFDKPPFTDDPLDNPAERELLAGGVICRVVYEQNSLAVPGRLAHVEAMAELSEDARMVPDLPTKLIVCDDRLAFVPLAGGTDLEQAIVVHPSPLLDALAALFEATWCRAVPLQLAVRAGPAELDADQRRLLALLSTGADDDEVGLRLGLSARTLHRRVGALMVALGVSTRFQLGVAAARRGWR